MKLLYTKRSPYARKVRVVAIEKGVNLDLIDEDLQNKSQRLLEANPLGKVPTLILDNGSYLYDSRVICQYLDEINDRIIMVPRSGQARYEVLKWEAFADDLMTVAINAYMEKIRHPNDFHSDFVRIQENNIQVALHHVEKHLTFLDTFSLAPIVVCSAIGYVQFRLPHLKIQGKLAQWLEMMHTRSSMQQTVPSS